MNDRRADTTAQQCGRRVLTLSERAVIELEPALAALMSFLLLDS
jgi:hypothetical protein